MPKIAKESKRKKILLLVAIGGVLISATCGFIWYNYIYNPVINFKNNIPDLTYSYCMDTNYVAGMGILKAPFCGCIAENLDNSVENKTTRKKEFEKRLDLATRKCSESTKFSTVSDSVLKKLYENTCLSGFGNYQKKYCDCLSNNIVYLIRQYSYDSAIKLHLDDIIAKASESCFGFYLKAEKHGK